MSYEQRIKDLKEQLNEEVEKCPVLHDLDYLVTTEKQSKKIRRYQRYKSHDLINLAVYIENEGEYSIFKFPGKSRVNFERSSFDVWHKKHLCIHYMYDKIIFMSWYYPLSKISEKYVKYGDIKEATRIENMME